MANTKIQSEQIEDDIALGGNPTTTTQSAGNNTTRVATTAFVTTAVANLVDSAPSALDTLNELAAAMGDDASFSTTITNSIATKLPLAGGTMTGDIAHASDFTIDAGGDITLDADGADIILKDGGTSFAELDKDNNNFRIKNPIADGDIKIQGVDGSSTITALDLDMSEAGKATFNAGGVFNDDVSVFGSDSKLFVGESGAGGTFGFLGWNDASNYLFLGNSYNSAFNTDIVISSTGNVGIGNSNPSSYYSTFNDLVIGDGSGDHGITIATGTSGSGTLAIADGTSGNTAYRAFFQYSNNTDKLFIGAGGGTKLTVRGSDGNLGIGNTSPSAAKLVITDSSDGGFGGTLILENSNASDTDKVAIALRPNGSATTALGSYGELRIIGEYDSGSTNGASNLQFHTHSGNGTVTERMRITSDGNLLFGTTVLTDISSSGTGNEGSFIKADGSSGFATSNQTLMTLNRKTSNGDVFEFRKDGTAVGSIGIEGGDSLYIQSDGASGGGLRFHNNGGIQPLRNGATIDNVIDLGTSTRRFKDFYLSGGLYVGGTGSANKLDDYEEGTWTPVFAGSTTTVNQATYTKIGDLVHLQFYIVFSPANTGDQAQITGLPFAPKSISSNYSAFSVGYVGDADWQDIGLLPISSHNGNAYIYFHYYSGNAASLARSDFYKRRSSNHPLIISGCYQAA